jgi:hypothetical protein
MYIGEFFYGWLNAGASSNSIEFSWRLLVYLYPSSSGARCYGKTKHGEFMSEAEARSNDY